MARSHIAVALGAALVASLIIGQLVVNLGFPTAEFWHWRLDQTYTGAQQTHLISEKQSGELVDDAASYLVGVGKADITGYARRVPYSEGSTDAAVGLSSSSI
jgi:neutral ceramidase